eukprot:scaffold586_cov68-Cylindrotheca_fusiformis.AAC.5
MVQQPIPAITTTSGTPKNHRGHRPRRMSQQARTLVYSSNCDCRPNIDGVLEKKAHSSFYGSITQLEKDNISTDAMSRRRRELLLDNSDRFMTKLQTWRLQVHAEIKNEEKKIKDNISSDAMSRRRRELLLDNSDRFMTKLQTWRLQVHAEIENEESDDESDFDDDTSSMSDWD